MIDAEITSTSENQKNLPVARVLMTVILASYTFERVAERRIIHKTGEIT